ncbi:MAG: hypothetical protein ABFD12_08635, partial [Syntrophorhabdus sp.]
MKITSLILLLAGMIAYLTVPGLAQPMLGISSELEEAFLEKPKLAKIQDRKEKENNPSALKGESPKATGNENPVMTDPASETNAAKKPGLSENIVKSTGIKTVNINFNGVPLNDALLSLARQAGVSVTIDRDIDVTKVGVTAYYQGESFEEAISSLVSGLDYAYRKVADGAYVVTPYEEAVFDVQDVHIKQREPI